MSRRGGGELVPRAAGASGPGRADAARGASAPPARLGGARAQPAVGRGRGRAAAPGAAGAAGRPPRLAAGRQGRAASGPPVAPAGAAPAPGRAAPTLSWLRLPFRFGSEADYLQRLNAWIAEAFYERLPRAGYEVREEQIYLSFRIAAALAAGRPILAEGGSGTGKTFAYLLPLICHARWRGRPAVVATATPALLEQLAAPDGDIAVLSRLLGLDVDARVAVAPEDAVCDVRVQRWRARPRRVRGRAALLRWWEGSRFGARREYPAASDELWAQVAWTPACRCDLCPRRGYCRLMTGRAHARAAADLIVVRHDVYFADLWAGEGRLAPGRLPVLPAHSAVVFDEGHRVAAEAQRAAGAHLVPAALRETILGCRGEGARLRLVTVVEAAADAAARFEAALARARVPLPGEERDAVVRTPELQDAARRLGRLLAALQDEAAVEEGLHEESPYAERLANSQPLLEAASEVLRRLADGPGSILWMEGPALWAVPRSLESLWRRLPAGLPVVFSSATLASGGSFAYTARTLGLAAPLTARVGVPFRLARQVLCYVPGTGPAPEEPAFWEATAAHLQRLLQATGGRALVLLPRPADTAALRPCWRWDGRTLWEGDAAPDALLAAFRQDVGSVLVGHSFWEGVDVPGEALSAVVVPLLPLPGMDPRVVALREDAARAGLDPRAAVDLPEMALRLRQGLGRLIRAETDRGILAVLDPRAAEPDVAAAVAGALPEGARRVRTLEPVRRFLEGGPTRSAGTQRPRRS